jgi:hypothetical protein
MKTEITIEYFSGESESLIASIPEFVKWERKTGLKVTQLEENIGLDDLLFLAYHAKKRELAGQAIKPFEVWCDTVDGIRSDKPENPKATPSEA